MIGWFVAALAADPLPPDLTVDLAEEADLLFRRGVEAYRARRYEDALQYLLASNRLAPNDVVVFDLARTHEELGQLPQAWRYYTWSLALSTSPELRQEAEQALRRITPKVARVSIQTDPAGAAIYLDGRDLGRRGYTPLVLALPQGQHHLVLEREGHAPVELDTNAVVGQLTEVQVHLTPDRPTEPDGSQATILQATARAAGVVLAQADGDRCEVLGAQAQRLPSPLVPAELAGSALAAQQPDTGELALELVVQEQGRVRTLRRSLPADGKRSLVLADPGPLHQVLFARCAPSDAGALGTSLAELPRPSRWLAVQLFAEWAAWKGAASVPEAAADCAQQGSCEALAALLVEP
jgi:tetratricopeptide (TPR) repeat protein